MEEQSPDPAPSIWTIGHSNHPLETFIDLIIGNRIAVLADVRSTPYCRYASHFNKEAIEHSLRDRGVEYVFLGDLLGGRAEGDRFYDQQGHVLYGRLAESPGFQRGISRLTDGVGQNPLALMCGEEDPTNCHRRLLIGRVLRTRGVNVLHIRGDGRIQSEEEIAKEEEFRKTKGQMTLFDMEEPDEWKSTQSVLPKNPPPSSSESSSGPESGG